MAQGRALIMSLMAAGMIGQGSSALASGPDSAPYTRTLDAVGEALTAVRDSNADMLAATADLRRALGTTEETLEAGVADIEGSLAEFETSFQAGIDATRQSLNDVERKLKLAGLGLGIATVLGGTGGVMVQQRLARRRREKTASDAAPSGPPTP